MNSLAAIRCFALDMDGTIYLGDRLLPGAGEFLDYLRQTGRRRIFLTNNSSRSRAAYLGKLARLGIDAVPDEVVTSGTATIACLNSRCPGARIFLLGTPDLAGEFAEAGFVLTADRPDYVVLGYDTTLTYDRLARACHLVRAGVPLIATHPDINCPTDQDSGYLPDAGAILALIRAATGVEAKIIGKPHREMIDALVAVTGADPAAVAMVGDRLYTDIQLAANAGITGILVLSGESGIDDIALSPAKPDYIFPSLRELHAALCREDSQLSGRTGGL
ncbi:MAG: HAD-IIA family hydrolase [Negativicutes bacterium]|nr:HAD-IIA family hydrolase [Negativicutes bacterium]